ncbi:MAG: hypothetical protein U1F42_05730 [Candidatus Competibacteraceae bacterium]
MALRIKKCHISVFITDPELDSARRDIKCPLFFDFVVRIAEGKDFYTVWRNRTFRISLDFFKSFFGTPSNIGDPWFLLKF